MHIWSRAHIGGTISLLLVRYQKEGRFLRLTLVNTMSDFHPPDHDSLFAELHRWQFPSWGWCFSPPCLNTYSSVLAVERHNQHTVMCAAYTELQVTVFAQRCTFLCVSLTRHCCLSPQWTSTQIRIFSMRNQTYESARLYACDNI